MKLGDLTEKFYDSIEGVLAGEVAEYLSANGVSDPQVLNVNGMWSIVVRNEDATALDVFMQALPDYLDHVAPEFVKE